MMNCPLLDINQISTHPYATKIVEIIRLFGNNPDYITFTHSEKCLYGYGHKDLVPIFTNYSYNVEDEFNVVNDNEVIGLIVNSFRNLRFIVTDVKNNSLRLYYLKTDQHFDTQIKIVTNPIYGYMKSKSILTDYVLNYHIRGGPEKLGDRIEKKLDNFILSINNDLRSHSYYYSWHQPKLYKKGGLAIKKLWGDYTSTSMHPYLNPSDFSRLTSKNSDYDTTILFKNTFDNQAQYTTIMNDIFKFISNSVRDKYVNTFVDISNEITSNIQSPINLDKLTEMYDELPPGTVLPEYNSTRDNIKVWFVVDNKIKISGKSCVSSPTLNNSYPPDWIRSWNTAWRNIKLPIEFRLGMTKIKYPSIFNYSSCNPDELKNLDTCFTLFRCMGMCEIKGTSNYAKKTNFEILDISNDCNFEKINTEIKLQSSSPDNDNDITLNFSSLLYDIYNIVTLSEEEMTKSAKRCSRLNEMLMIYDKIGEDEKINVDFFTDHPDDKIRFLKNYLRFCEGYKDFTNFNDDFIRGIPFKDFTNIAINKIFKVKILPNVNLTLRNELSSVIKRNTLPGLNHMVSSFKDCLKPGKVFLQGGIKLLILLETLKQKGYVAGVDDIKNMITPIDFDYFMLYKEDNYPLEIVEQFNDCNNYYINNVQSAEWKELSDEQNKMIYIRNRITNKKFYSDNHINSVYNMVDDGYYIPSMVKSSRPYVVCSKTRYFSCAYNKDVMAELNFIELNIVNISWCEKIQNANTNVSTVESPVLLLQAVYMFINTLIEKGQFTEYQIENFSFLLSSYMNYVYNLKPKNSLLRFLVASFYMIEVDKETPQTLSNLFNEFRRSFISQGLFSLLKYKYYNSTRQTLVEAYFDETAVIDIVPFLDRENIDYIPFNPFANNYTTNDRIRNDINKIINLVSLDILAKDANIRDVRCDA